MNLFILSNNGLDEIVFENRNKLYGAYMIRKSYDGNLLKATAYSFLLLALLFLAGYGASFIREEVKPVFSSSTFSASPAMTASTIEIILDDLTTKLTLRSTDNLNYRIVRNELATTPLTTPADPQLPVNADEIDRQGAAGNTTPGTGGTGEPGNIPEPPVVTDAPFVTFATTMPAFPGGTDEMGEYIRSHLRYPADAVSNSIEGKVVVSFVVDIYGRISQVKIERALGFGCDDEAVRVISSMPDWEVGIQNGKRVPVKMILPIQFRLK